ncbi:MAG: hypothetical protein M1457_03585 [bacterium]|nr:hypothetical protein [bacterium]
MGEVLYEAIPVNGALSAAAEPPRERRDSPTVTTKAPARRRPAPSEAPAASLWRLEGIFYDEANPLAVIDDNIVKIGSRVGGASVVEIRRDCVVLEQGGSRRELHL